MTVELAVRHQYVGRVPSRHSFDVRFLGDLRHDSGRTVLEGEVGYRLVWATDFGRLLRWTAVAVAVLAIVVGIEGLATKRMDEVAALLMVGPAILLYAAAHRVQAWIDRSALADATLIRRFLDATL